MYERLAYTQQELAGGFSKWWWIKNHMGVTLTMNHKFKKKKVVTFLCFLYLFDLWDRVEHSWQLQHMKHSQLTRCRPHPQLKTSATQNNKWISQVGPKFHTTRSETLSHRSPYYTHRQNKKWPISIFLMWIYLSKYFTTVMIVFYYRAVSKWPGFIVFGFD